MKRSGFRFFAALFVSLTLLLGAVAPALAATATEVVREKQSALFDLIRKSGPEEQKKVGELFDQMLDYDALAKGSLGTEWDARTEAERKEFTDLLRQLVRKAYERNLKKTLDFDIQYVGEATANEVTTVKTRAVSRTDKREEPVEIDYRLAQRDGSWRVQDIVTEGVSLVSNYRSQFTKIIKKEGFPALLQKMRDKLAKGDV